jgi:hypothetical protein
MSQRALELLTGNVRNAYKILVAKPRGKQDHLGGISIDGIIILKWKGCGADSSGSGYGPVSRFCVHGVETIEWHRRVYPKVSGLSR